MKHIGVMIPAITEDLQRELLDGIFRTVSCAGYDVVVLTTTTSGLDYNIQNAIMDGEENIYSLLDSISLSGVIFASQYFLKGSVREMIAARIRNAGIPCVDLGGTSLGFLTVGTGQDEAVCELTDHVIEHHGSRDLIFLAGPEGHPESEQRISGFLRSASEHKCRYEVVYGDFWKRSAAELADEIIRHKRSKPDAVLCASDIMAVSLCEALRAGGISVPEDIIVTGFDGQICALSHFPSITTVSGGMSTLGRLAAECLLRAIGDETELPDAAGMRIMYGASCGCAERMKDYRTAALLVQEHIRQEEEESERLEMRINADMISRAACVGSLEELTAIIDQTSYIFDDLRSLHICLCSDWEGDPGRPEDCRTKGYSRKMLCVISKENAKPAAAVGSFRTEQILPILSKPHKPLLVFILPLHATAQAFGYCGFVYENAADFKITVMLANVLSAFASGLRMLRQKSYAEHLQRQIEEASLYDKMTDMLSKKGLLQYLRRQPHKRTGVMLVTIARFSGAAFGQRRDRMADTVVQSELMLANAIRLISGYDHQAARLDKQTFAVVFPLDEEASPEDTAEELMIQLEVLLRRMHEGTAAGFLPEPFCVCGVCKAPEDGFISALWEKLNSSQPKENGFIGISQLRMLRREIHKAPEIDWSLEELARRLNISKSYVQKLYKQHFGIGYMDDLINARINAAKRLLSATDLTVSEVAASCGYQNATHFMRQFREKTGLTPTGYRKAQNK